ncbi:PAP2-domain-containing protein [Rickenella mellea]|uniref:PAP2-domain-containing protein n=1 Tax=Rickenella mellea TaxID=50990 RepID=A0A4Y7PZE2_9AGAM|nr:PAP2-domain-containing protein [Rickenella mellea]
MPPRLSSPTRALNRVLSAFIAAVGRLDKSLSPSDTIAKLRSHTFTFCDTIYIFHILQACFWLYLMKSPPFPLKLGIPILYTIALLIPFTSQFFVPATPVFSWVLTYFSAKFVPEQFRPTISVSLLPTLESVLYGANISDILTRYTHPILDVMAWLPYGVLHFTLPFVVAAFLWLFRPKEALHFWARVFGYMNLIGVWVQTILPCAAPWYELIYGLTPADYSVPGSAGGLARIDALFGSKGYQTTFAASPVVFGAFPSLHAGCATLEALAWSHFFPQTRTYAWAYCGLLYWATMYLTHHYLIDVVCGACLATAAWFLFLTDDLRYADFGAGGRVRSKHELYDLEAPPKSRRAGAAGRIRAVALDADGEDEEDWESSPRASDEEDITYRSPNPTTPHSAVPLMKNQQTQGGGKGGKGKRSHRHTASIASLIRADERVEEGWSPIGGKGFKFPPTPLSGKGERVERDV